MIGAWFTHATVAVRLDLLVPPTAKAMTGIRQLRDEAWRFPLLRQPVGLGVPAW